MVERMGYLIKTAKSWLLMLCMGVPVAYASNYLGSGQSFTQFTYLIEVTQDLYLSQKAKNLRSGGFETSNGRWVDFDRWYSAKWQDTRVSWMTQITPSFGLLWGVSSGEKAEKYSIDSGLRLGFLMQKQVSKHSHLSFSGSTVIGGRLKEKTCMADYGEIGGIQEVNCRLAASVLEPSKTLNYLYNQKPESAVQIKYRLSFY